MNRRWRFALTLLGVAVLPPSATAHELGSTDAPPMTLEGALARAIASNPDLTAFAFRHEEQAGRIDQAGRLPNLQLGVTVENALGGGPYDDFDQTETTLGIAWLLEGRQRRRRVAAERARAGLVGAEAEVLRLDVAAETAQRFVACLVEQGRLALAAEGVRLARGVVATAALQAEIGSAPPGDLARARAAEAQARFDALRIEQTFDVAMHRLAAQWGRIEPSFDEVAGDLGRLPTVAPYEELVARSTANPELVRLASAERVARAELDLTLAERWPTVTPGVAVRRFEQGDDYAMVGELALPLPVFDRRQGDVTTGRAAVERSRAEQTAARVRIRTTLYQLYHQLGDARETVRMLRETVIPLLEGARAETREGFARGEDSHTALLQARIDLLDARRREIDASANVHRIVIELERLTGEVVAIPDPAPPMPINGPSSVDLPAPSPR